MPDLMYFQWGSHIHPPGEVNLTKMEMQPIFSQRNDRWAVLKKLHLVGEIQFTPAEDAATAGDIDARQALFDTKITALRDAYATNYHNGGLYHSNGTPTKHALDTTQANNISGTRVAYRSWNRGAGDEYATVRTFYIILEALFDEADSGLYAYREQIRMNGTGGEHWQWVENPLLIPIKQTIARFTHQTIVQWGQIVGVNFWPLGNVPPPIYPQWEHQPHRTTEYEYPTWFGNAYRLYGYSWRYYMEAPLGQVAVPNLY